MLLVLGWSMGLYFIALLRSSKPKQTPETCPETGPPPKHTPKQTLKGNFWIRNVILRQKHMQLGNQCLVEGCASIMFDYHFIVILYHHISKDYRCLGQSGLILLDLLSLGEAAVLYPGIPDVFLAICCLSVRFERILFLIPFVCWLCIKDLQALPGDAVLSNDFLWKHYVIETRWFVHNLFHPHSAWSNTLGLKCGPFRRISRKWMRTSGLDDTVQHGHLKGLPAMIRCDCRFWDPILWACYDLVDLNYFGLFSPLSRCHSWFEAYELKFVSFVEVAADRCYQTLANSFLLPVLRLLGDKGESLWKFPYSPRTCSDTAAVEVLENSASLRALLWFKNHKCKQMAVWSS